MVKFFINRPIFATVLCSDHRRGGFGHPQYITDRPVSGDHAAYRTGIRRLSGADAQTVAQTVGLPIEQQVNGVDGMLYMSSNSSSSGAYS